MNSSCSCDRQISSHDETGVYFNGLHPTEDYFALVARTEVGSLFGLPPHPVSPNAQLSNSIGTSSTANLIPGSNSATHIGSSRSVRGDTPLPHFSEGLDESDIESPEERDPPSIDSVNRQQVKASSKGLNRSDVESQSAFEEDAKAWDSWHGEALHLLCPQSIPTLGANILVCGSKMIPRTQDMLTLNSNHRSVRIELNTPICLIHSR
jgi:hypothetical protein